MSDEAEKDRVQATEYVRELSDEQLVALDTAITARTIQLMGQGVPLPLELIRTHHVIGLLEAVAGPEITLRVKEWHLTWVDRQFDKAEANMRAQMLASGLFDQFDASDATSVDSILNEAESRGLVNRAERRARR